MLVVARMLSVCGLVSSGSELQPASKPSYGKQEEEREDAVHNGQRQENERFLGRHDFWRYVFGQGSCCDSEEQRQYQKQGGEPRIPGHFDDTGLELHNGTFHGLVGKGRFLLWQELL